jgi:anaerobic sulfite reductase subunit B
MGSMSPTEATTRGFMTPLPYRVTGRRAESLDTLTLEIEPVDEALAAPRAGQFNMLWAFGVGEVPISVSGRRTEGPLHHTIRSVGATTRALCSLAEGDTLGARGPFGHGWDLDSARGHDVVVITGGLGLAPLKPVVEEIIEDRDAFKRVDVLIGARSPDELLFVDVVSEWRARFDLHVEITVDHARDHWHGDVGVVTSLLPRIPIDPESASVFVCGPEIMMRFASSAVLEAGVAAERIQLSLERNMACAIAQCGHCQLGPSFLCREGPVYTLDAITPLLTVRAL